MYCLLSTEYRYLIVFVEKDGAFPTNEEKLVNLRWLVLQTRTLSDYHDISSHDYEAKRGGILNAEIIRSTVKNNVPTYKCEKLPITISLLHNLNSSSDYQPKGTVIAALETYQTIVMLNK
jgi:hypothetical protein